MKRGGLNIIGVVPGSLAEELDLEHGDLLVAINGHVLRDVIDYNFHAADDNLLLDVIKKDGEHWEVEVEREEGESLGLIFSPPKPFQCGNHCVFCFVDQLPPGLRSPLYVKDEDYRLSFLYGNYVTLSNIGSADLERIKQQRLSPLYVSVHATDPALRERLLGRSRIKPILPLIQDLAAARITMHTQVVLCPGINDGAALEKTVEDLASLYPQVSSLAVVPLGVTGHRAGLPDLRPVDREYARDFVSLWEPKSRELAVRLHSPFLFLADEFYIKGGLPFPPLEVYGDLPQIENGVGMIPLFLEESREVLEFAQRLPSTAVTVITGESPYSYIANFLHALSHKTGIELRPVAVKNVLFGESVTVTGLVSGGDIIEALRGRDLGEAVLLPDIMLKEGEGVFLDGLTVEDVEKGIGCRLTVVETTPAGIYEALRGM